ARQLDPPRITKPPLELVLLPARLARERLAKHRDPAGRGVGESNERALEPPQESPGQSGLHPARVDGCTEREPAPRRG
ncbi:hypothetical protein DF186_24835, partial [Enterococcus hirae]